MVVINVFFTDHLIHGNDRLYVILFLLLSNMITHNIVPDDLLESVLIPIPKDKKIQSRVTLGWRHSKNRIQVMRIHKLLQLLHRRARTQARARLTKGARNPQFSSVLSRNRS